MITKKEVKSLHNGQPAIMISDPHNIAEDFARMAALIGERARATMLLHLLDGRAYTATELALCADILPSSASNHLSRLVAANLLSVSKQGRHKYYTFATDDIASAIEQLVSITSVAVAREPRTPPVAGIKFARTCYDHLAGRVGVLVTEALLQNSFILPDDQNYSLTGDGEHWFESIGVNLRTLYQRKRRLAFPCLDWSERRQHLGGALGAAFLNQALELNWIRRIQHSREVIITSEGRQKMEKELGFCC